MAKSIKNFFISTGCFIAIIIGVSILPVSIYFFHAETVEFVTVPTIPVNGFGAGFADGLMMFYNIAKGFYTNTYHVFDAHSNGWYNFGFVSAFIILTAISSKIVSSFLLRKKN